MNKTSSDKLPDRSEFLAALLESTNEAIVACDADGVLSYFNKKSLEIHGLPAHPILPEEWAQHYDLYHTDGVTLMRKEELPLFRALNGERVENVEIIIKRKDTNPVLMSCNGRPLFDSQGKKTGAMATMHDITEARKANDELNSAFETSES